MPHRPTLAQLHLVCVRCTPSRHKRAITYRRIVRLITGAGTELRTTGSRYYYYQYVPVVVLSVTVLVLEYRHYRYDYW